MGKYDLPKYDDWRKWIQRKREKGIAWPQIFLACKNDVQGLSSFLKTRAEEDDFPVLTIEEWYELVEEIKEYESYFILNALECDNIIIDENLFN